MASLKMILMSLLILHVEFVDLAIVINKPSFKYEYLKGSDLLTVKNEENVFVSKDEISFFFPGIKVIKSIHNLHI